jgi:cytidyltransferase-like protein
MIGIGYVPGAFDLFHIGHLNILRQAKENCDYLIAGVAAEDVLIRLKGVTPVIPLLERLEIVQATSSSALRRILLNIDAITTRARDVATPETAIAA